MYIKGEDLRAFGCTVGCPRRDHKRRYGPGGATKVHSKQCRERIMEELSKTPEGQRRLAVVDERRNRALAEHFERGAQEPHSQGGGDGAGDMPNGVPETDLKFEDVAPSDQRLDDPPQLPLVDTEPPIQPTYPTWLTDDDSHSVPPSPGGDAPDSVAGDAPSMDLDVLENDIFH